MVKEREEYKNALIYLPKDSEELNFENYYKSQAFRYDVKEPQYDFQFNYAKYLHRKKYSRNFILMEQFYQKADMIFL